MFGCTAAVSSPQLLGAAALSSRPVNACRCPQVNAFCNTDDITWGTKNLDTKKDATEAKHLMKSGLAYTANQVGRPGGTWRGGQGGCAVVGSAQGRLLAV